MRLIVTFKIIRPFCRVYNSFLLIPEYQNWPLCSERAHRLPAVCSFIVKFDPIGMWPTYKVVYLKRFPGSWCIHQKHTSIYIYIYTETTISVNARAKPTHYLIDKLTTNIAWSKKKFNDLRKKNYPPISHYSEVSVKQ